MAFPSTCANSRPESRGEVMLRSSDPFAPPVIRANAFSTETDRRALCEGIEIIRDIAAQPAPKAISGPELRLGDDIQSPEAIEAWIQETAELVFHPVGTCAMGIDDDRMAVLDSQLRVRGIAGLRVADASVIPQVVGGNTNGPTITIGEKAAAMILNEAPQHAETAELLVPV